MKHLQLKRRSVAEVKNDLNNAFVVANKRQGESYKLGMTLIETLPNDLTLETRGVNCGDIAEVVFKYHADKLGYAEVVSDILTYARQGLNDLNKNGVNEVKYFGASNNTPNGTLTPKAFYGISKYGVYHFTYEVVKRNFKDFKLDKRTGTRAMTYAIMKTLINNGEVKRLDKLSKALGL